MDNSGQKTARRRSSLRHPRGSAADWRAARRGHDPDRTREDILNVATEEFASAGFSGARVDMIAERTSTSKRMIYYYFSSKEGLYLAVLEKVYGELRAAEMGLDVAHQSP